MFMVPGLILLLLGTATCFFGYKLFRVYSAIFGFFVGYLVGIILGAAFGMEFESIAILAFVVGIVGAVLAYRFYKVAVFLSCFFTGAMYGIQFALRSQMKHPVSKGLEYLLGGFDLGTFLRPILLAAAIGGIITGVLGVIFEKHAIILSTGLGGGATIGLGLMLFLNSYGGGYSVVGTLLGILGIVVQYKLSMKGQPGPFRARQSSGEGKAPVQFSLASVKKHLPSPKAGESGASLMDRFTSMTGTTEVQTTRNCRRKQRRTVLASADVPLWREGSPVAVTECNVVKTGENTVGADLAIQNLTEKDVVGVVFALRCQDLLKEELQGLDRVVVQDTTIAPGAVWFSPSPFSLPDGNTRRLEVTLRNVVYADGTIWNAEDAPLVPFRSQESIGLSPDLAEEFAKEVEEQTGKKNLCSFRPEQKADYWNCTCGQICFGPRCLVCGMDHDTLFRIYDPEYLQTQRSLRTERLLQQEAAREAQRKQEEEERRQRMEQMKESARKTAGDIRKKTVETGRTVAKTAGTYGTAILNRAKQPADTGAEDQPAAPAADSGAHDAPAFCPQCGHKLIQGARFCANCGTQISL